MQESPFDAGIFLQRKTRQTVQRSGVPNNSHSTLAQLLLEGRTKNLLLQTA